MKEVSAPASSARGTLGARMGTFSDLRLLLID